MKIVLTGGGSGGHFYPLIAVAEHVREIVEERKLLTPDLYYIGPQPFDNRALVEAGITYIKTPAGKIRRYPSIWNFFDLFKTAWGVVRSVMLLFSLYPDVVFSKGGYASFPTVTAARLLRIPVIIHESDAVPGKANAYAAKFARWIGIAHSDAAQHFPEKVQERIALVGNPIRKEIEQPAASGGYEFLKLEEGVPVLFVLGGSQGSEAINNVILDALPELLEKFCVVHQTGIDHLETVRGTAEVVLHNSRYQERYRPFGLLNTLAIRMVAGIATVVISRAGSGTIFEIASWGIPSILVPIPENVSHDQERNAFTYARAGAAVVLKQHNLTPHILIAEVNRIMDDPQVRAQMAEAAKAYARPDAAQKMARIVIDTALEHTDN